jgi:hypothetical protein
MWSKTVTFLHIWGEGAAIILSIFATTRILTTFITWLYGVAVLRDVLGCTRQLFWTFCPDVFMLRQFREFNREQRAEEGDEVYVVGNGKRAVESGQDPAPKRLRGFINGRPVGYPKKFGGAGTAEELAGTPAEETSSQAEDNVAVGHRGFWKKPATSGIAPRIDPV